MVPKGASLYTETQFKWEHSKLGFCETLKIMAWNIEEEISNAS